MLSGTSTARLPAETSKLAARALDSNEASLMARDGLVITEDTVTSFHVGYTALFRAHQPVYFTADALLEAWHASYDAILADLEESALVPTLNELLKVLRTGLQAATGDSGNEEAHRDVDGYLAVAASLASDLPAQALAGCDAGAVAAIVERAKKADGSGELVIAGQKMLFDYSMMKPRGHYTRSVQLERYFRTMSWLGRVELRLAGRRTTGGWEVDRRVVRATALLRSLFSPEADRRWNDLDRTMNAFVGPPDSMSLAGFDAALKSLGMPLASAPDDAIVRAFLPVAGQRIGTQLLRPGDEKIAFVTLGQRYVYDAHVLSAVSYGQLQTKRMMPTPLDVAYTVFHHPGARTLLEPEIAAYGAEYSSALDAMWKRTDAIGPTLWKGSLYHLWLGALRELSPDPERDKSLPAPLGSEVWGRRLLNTQLASWAELRHDNILYAKQSVSAMALCDYPHGYVDPYPTFFLAFEELAKKAETTLAALTLESPVKRRAAKYFERFGAVASRLRAMAEKERRNEPLDGDDLDYLNRMVSIDGRHAGCTTVLEANGWYADLYYDRSAVLWQKPVIADVHTQPTDAAGNEVGRILHVATSYPRMFAVTVRHDGGVHARTYRGFVSSYAEKTTEHYERLTDEMWQEQVSKAPPRPPAWVPSLTP